MKAVTAFILVLVVVTFPLGCYIIYERDRIASNSKPPTWPVGTVIQVPVIAFDMGTGGNPVAGVKLLAMGDVQTSVFTNGPGEVPANITLIAGGSYIFQAWAIAPGAYPMAYATMAASMVMSNVKGAQIVIKVNSVAKTVTNIEFSFPIY